LTLSHKAADDDIGGFLFISRASNAIRQGSIRACHGWRFAEGPAFMSAISADSYQGTHLCVP